MLFNEKKLKIVAIGAHPDDIELACGGTLSRAIQQGHSVTMVIVTGNSSNDHNGNSIRTKEEAKNEQFKASSKLGVDNIGISIMSQKGNPFYIYIKNLMTPAANILKQEALSIQAELATPRDTITYNTDMVNAILIANKNNLKY